ncbi:MAG: ABC transporter ATP-binding protein [Spirochaetaceae bacterium]|jgi:putative ABC transport system ATP-binding protein|nr:ABC transporter ATP-binding protein [Spirochaetaceae bacterium]
MMLEIHEVSKTYLRGQTPFFALQDVSLSLEAGDFVCIAGPSGSGKSTLLGIAAGLISPTQGQVCFQGQDYNCLSDETLSALRNQSIGYIMQGPSLLPNFTVLQNVLLPYYIGPQGNKLEGAPIERASTLLEQVGMLALAAQYPAELSGGELRRVAIARALVLAPTLVIADEPTGDLDDGRTEEVMRLFTQAAQAGAAILVVTHDTAPFRSGNRRYILQAGRLHLPPPSTVEAYGSQKA